MSDKHIEAEIQLAQTDLFIWTIQSTVRVTLSVYHPPEAPSSGDCRERKRIKKGEGARFRERDFRQKK